MSEILTSIQEEYLLPQPTSISQEVQAPKLALTLQDFDKDSNSNEEEKDDQLSSSFYDDLVLPQPNPLPRKKRGLREPLRLIYDYPYRHLIKFEGREIIEKLVEEDRPKSERIRARIFREVYQEKQVVASLETEVYRPSSSSVHEYFKDDETLVYKIRSNKPDSFNYAAFTLASLKGEKKAKAICYFKKAEDEYEETYYKPKDEDDRTLVFESRFECGNLAMVSKIGENEYNLILQNDVNTMGFGQWFFFEVMNTRANQKVKFNIINYRKNDSLHNYGMKILVFSSKKSEKEAIGWVRDGANVNYSCNVILREHIPNKFYRTLSWEYEFKHDNDKVFFAYTHPYTYTDLVEFLDKLEDDETKNKYFVRSTLCRTVAGNKCEVLTITHNKKPEDVEKKKCIVLTGRVHPGETCSSFVMQGVIDFLLSEATEAQFLREKFIFKIVPMLNPDGVIHGNSRCSLEGCDLNRKWRAPSKELHPTIFYTKKMIRTLHEKYGVDFFCDFHGHSKKKDIFLYGCQEVTRSAEARIFPWMLSQVSKAFDYYKCTFHMHPSKASTSRVVLYKQLKIQNSCTIETSFFGSEKTNYHYSVNDLVKFGPEFCKALSLYFYKEKEPENDSESVKSAEEPTEFEKDFRNQREEMLKGLYSNEENLEVGCAADESGSESEASEDELSASELAKLVPGSKIVQNSESSPRRNWARTDLQKASKSMLEKKSPERNSPLRKSPEPKAERKYIEPRVTVRHKSNSIAVNTKDSNLLTTLLPIATKVYQLGSVNNLSLANTPSKLVIKGESSQDVSRDGSRVYSNNASPVIGPLKRKNDVKVMDLGPTFKQMIYEKYRPGGASTLEAKFKQKIQAIHGLGNQILPTGQNGSQGITMIHKGYLAAENNEHYVFSHKQASIKARTEISHAGFKKMQKPLQPHHPHHQERVPVQMRDRSQIPGKTIKTAYNLSRKSNSPPMQKLNLHTSFIGSPKDMPTSLTDRARKSDGPNLNILKIVEEVGHDRIHELQDPNDPTSLQPFSDFAMSVSIQQRRKNRDSVSNDLTLCLESSDEKKLKSRTPLPSLQTLLRNINSHERQEKRKKTLVVGSGNTTGIFNQSANMMEEVYPKMFVPRSKTNIRQRPGNNLPKLGSLSMSMKESC